MNRTQPRQNRCNRVYLRDHGDSETFSKQELQQAFESAGESVPATYPRH